ncbi:YunC family protein [Thermaerobacter litoralis]
MPVVEVRPIPLRGGTAIGVKVELPKTRLVAIATPAGYIMCGALDVRLLDDLLGARRIVAGRALGVRDFDDLLDRPLESVTSTARELGIHPGMKGREALERLLATEPVPAAPGGGAPGEGSHGTAPLAK